MLRRRTTVVGATAFLAVPLRLIRPARSQPAEQAVAFIKSTTEQLVAIVNTASSPLEKHRRLREVIDSTADVGDIAQFCLGRFWHIATLDQQKQYTALFHELLVTKIFDQRRRPGGWIGSSALRRAPPGSSTFSPVAPVCA